MEKSLTLRSVFLNDNDKLENISVSKRPADFFIINAYDDTPGKEYYLCDDFTIGAAFSCNAISYNQTKDLKDYLQFSESVDTHIPHLVQYILLKSNDTQDFKTPVTTSELGSIFNDFQKELIEAEGSFSIDVIVTVKAKINKSLPDEDEIDEFIKLKDAISEKLNENNFEARNICPENLIRIYKSILAPDNNAQYNEDQLICNQILRPKSLIEVSQEPLRINDSYVCVLSSRRVPLRTLFGDAIRYCGDIWKNDSNYHNTIMVTVNIFYPGRIDEEPDEEQLARKEAELLVSTESKVDMDDPEIENKIRISISIAFANDDVETLKSRVVVHTQNLNQIDLRFGMDTYFQLPILMNMLPMNSSLEIATSTFRYRDVDQPTLTKVLPIFAEPQRNERGGIVFRNRTGTLSSISMNSSRGNAVIFSESGSLHSKVLTKTAIINCLSNNQKVLALTANNDLRLLSKMVDGKLFNLAQTKKSFQHEASGYLDPFEMFHDSTMMVFEDDIISLVLSIINADYWMDQQQYDAISSGIKTILANNGRDTNLSLLHKIFAASESKLLNQAALRIQSFINESTTQLIDRPIVPFNFQTQLFNISFASSDDLLLQSDKVSEVLLVRMVLEICRAALLDHDPKPNVAVLDQSISLTMNRIYQTTGIDLVHMLNQSRINCIVSLTHLSVRLYESIANTKHGIFCASIDKLLLDSFADLGIYSRNDILNIKSLSQSSEGHSFELYFSDHASRGVYALYLNEILHKALTADVAMSNAIQLLLESGTSLKQSIASAEVLPNEITEKHETHQKIKAA